MACLRPRSASRLGVAPRPRTGAGPPSSPLTNCRLATCLLATLAVTSCAPGARFRQEELFAEYGEDGSVQYYRLILEGESLPGRSGYRSGWYDADAVDAQFGAPGGAPDLSRIGASGRAEAIASTLEQYLGLLADPDSHPADLLPARERYEEALTRARGLVSLGEPPESALDHTDEKFVMVIAPEPERVLEALERGSQSERLKETVDQLFGQRAERESAGSDAELELLQLRLELLADLLERYGDELSEVSTVDLESSLQRLTAALEAQR